jgi:hypothetical protein
MVTKLINKTNKRRKEIDQNEIINTQHTKLPLGEKPSHYSCLDISLPGWYLLDMHDMQHAGAVVLEEHVYHVMLTQWQRLVGVKRADEDRVGVAGVDLNGVTSVATDAFVARTGLERCGESGCPPGHYYGHDAV